MKLDSTAAAYGLIQVVFADATDQLANAVFLLKQKRPEAEEADRQKLDSQIAALPESELARAERLCRQVYKLPFSKLLDAFRDELKHLDKQEGVADPHLIGLADDLYRIREACQKLKDLSTWRNNRIHARVLHVDDGLALYESKTGKRLSISYADCGEILQKLEMVIATLATCLPSLFRSLDFNIELVDFFKEHFEEIED